MGTLTQFRKDLDFDDLRILQKALRSQIALLKAFPELEVELNWSKNMIKQCAEADEGKRNGSTTASMIQFYLDSATYMLERVDEALK